MENYILTVPVQYLDETEEDSSLEDDEDEDTFLTKEETIKKFSDAGFTAIFLKNHTPFEFVNRCVS